MNGCCFVMIKFIMKPLSLVRNILFSSLNCSCVQMQVLPQRLLKAERSSRRESGSARFSSPLWSKSVPAQAKPSRPEPQRCSNRRGAGEHAFPQTNIPKDKLFTSQTEQRVLKSTLMISVAFNPLIYKKTKPTNEAILHPFIASFQNCI